MNRDNVVKYGPTFPIPASWLQGPCWRCGAESADEKRVDIWVGAWECAHHYDDEMAVMSGLIRAACERQIERCETRAK